MEGSSPVPEQADTAAETSEGSAFTDTQEAKTEETPEQKKQNTKRVSERINALRAEKDAEIQALMDKIKTRDSELLKYRAAEQGVTVEELEAAERKEAERIREAVKNDPEFKALQQRDFERYKADVLAQIREAHPDDNVESLDSLPADFYKMLQAGVDPLRAYRASVVDEQRTAPPSAGSVKTKAAEDSKFFSRERVESMSREEIMAHYDDVIASQKKWK